jgi:hypothetical protein
MERRANKIAEQYITTFKDGIKTRLFEMNVLDKHTANQFMEYIYDYERLVFTKEDLTKRKRMNNEIPIYERCGALLNNGEQCTRRKKDSTYCGTHCKFDMHEKSKKMTGVLPSGSIKKSSKELKNHQGKKDIENQDHDEDIDEDTTETIDGDESVEQNTRQDYREDTEHETTNKTDKKMDVFTEEIGGIVYYMDKYNNLYKPEDILNDKKNPAIIGKGICENGIWKYTGLHTPAVM